MTTPARQRAMTIPWPVALLAIVGLAIPTILNATIDVASWPITVGWLVVLAVFAWLSPAVLPTRRHRITTAVLLLPVLFLLAWEGGWWLIPADLLWLLIEWRTRDPAPPPEPMTGARPR